MTEPVTAVADRSMFDIGVVSDEKIQLFCEKCNQSFDKIREERNYIKNCMNCGSKLKARCRKCQQLYKTVRLAKDHVQYACKVRKGFKCTECNHVAKKKYLMVKHYGKKHPHVPPDQRIGIELSEHEVKHGNAFSCYNCDFKCIHKAEIRMHILNNHSEDIISKCGKVFEWEMYLKKHEASCGIMSYECIYCPKTWSNSRTIKTHLTRTHVEEIGAADVNEILERICNLARDKRAVPDDKIKNYCYICKESFDVVYHKNNKIMVNCPKCSTKMKFQCWKCKSTFSTSRSTRQHVAKTCSPPQKLFNCSDCNHVANKRQALDIHMQRVHGKSLPKKIRKTKSRKIRYNTYKCMECNYETDIKYKIQLHILSNHPIDKNVIYCTKCGETFEREESLKLHIVTCGFKNYNCKYCTKQWLTTESCRIKDHLLETHAKEFGLNDLGNIIKEICNEAYEMKADLLTSTLGEGNFHLRKRNRTNVVPDKMMKLYCKKCVESYDKIRVEGRVIIKKRCPKCSRRIKYQCRLCKKSYRRKGSTWTHIAHYCKKYKKLKARSVQSND